MKFDEKNIKTIDQANIESFFELLENRTAFFLENKSIEELISFINGYLNHYTKSEIENNPWIVFESFKQWLSLEYSDIWISNQSKLIKIFKELSSVLNTDPFKQFWIEWKKYVEHIGK